MANPLRFTYTNHADAAVITGTAAITSLPLSNLKNDDIQQLWRSASTAAAQAIIIALPSPQIIGCVSLINCNVLSPASFHVRVSTTDATGLTGDAYNVSGISGIPDAAHNKFVHFLEPQVTGTYVRINMNDLTVAPEAGRLVVGEVWAPSRDMRYGFEPLSRDLSNISTSLGGNEFVDVRPRKRGYHFTIIGLTETEAQDQVDRLNRTRGIGRDILVCRNKDSANLGRDTVWGLLAQPVIQRKIEARVTEDDMGAYEIEVEVWDRI